MSSCDLASSLMYAQLSKPKLCLLGRSHGPDLGKNARGYLTESLPHPKNLCNPESPNQAQIQIVAYFMASTRYEAENAKREKFVTLYSTSNAWRGRSPTLRPSKSRKKTKSQCLDLAERGMIKSRVPPENVRTFVVDVGWLAGFISTLSAVRDRFGRVTATSMPAFKSTKRCGTTTRSRAQQWGLKGLRAQGTALLRARSASMPGTIRPRSRIRIGTPSKEIYTRVAAGGRRVAAVRSHGGGIPNEEA